MKVEAKEIIKLCPNYYKIVNTPIDESDKVSEKLVRIYEDYLFSVDLREKDQAKKVTRIDKVLNEYFNDFRFKKELANKLKNVKVKSKIENITEFVVNNIIEIFDEYLENYTRNIYIPRWI